MSRTLSCTETAKLVRKALRADFPDVKFSVRSRTYSGGASISVGWSDGPTVADVDGTLSLYTGASFDGMTDMQSYHDSLLMTDDDPEVVHFGADYVHGSRATSEVRRRVYRHELKRFLASLGAEYIENGRIPVQCHDGQLSHDTQRGEWGSCVVEQMGYARPWEGERCPGSPDPYCAGCGRWQKGHEREPHLR